MTIWCCASSTGEEPYSLAMALIEVFRRSDPPVTILATDIDPDVLHYTAEPEPRPITRTAETPGDRLSRGEDIFVFGR